nr:TRAP transporter substrate-binding protein DctP [Natronocella acetinitrilica]
MGEERVTWRLGHTLTVPGSLYEEIITKEVPERIAEASGGMVQVRPLIGVIGTDDVLNALRRDRIQMGSLTVAYSAATYPLWAVLNLPGLVNDNRLIGPISRELVLPEIEKDMHDMGIRPVVVVSWDGGGYFSNRPVRNAGHFNGLRWRTHAPMLSQVINALGGSTVGMPFEELQPSLERRLVDAYTTTFPAMHAAGLYSATRYAIEAPNGTSLAVIMVSEQALERLPENVRADVVAELRAINEDVADRLHQEYLDTVDAIQREGVELIRFSEEEAAKVTDAAKEAVWEPWLRETGERGEQLLEAIQNYQP